MQYELIVVTDPAQQRVTLRLLDKHGVQRGAQQVDLSEHSPALWEGLFDTRQYVRLHQGNLRLDGRTRPATAAQLLEHLGVFIGTQVLGTEIMRALVESPQRRTLLVKLPPTAEDVLAAAFATVPGKPSRKRLIRKHWGGRW